MLKYIFPILFIVVACTSNSDEHAITMDELSGTTSKYDHIDSVKQVVVAADEKPKQSFFLTAFDSLYKQATWRKMDTFLFPERFGPVFSEKWILYTSTDSIVAFNYEFSDSLKTRNAFFNWLDCFGTTCESYTVGANVKKQKRSRLLLVGHTRMLYIEGKSKIPTEKIIAVFSPTKKDRNWSYVMEIPPYQKTNWYRIEKGEQQAIVKP